MRKFLAVLLFFLLLLWPSALAESTPHWLQVRTAHFLVLTNGSEHQARHTAGQLERMQAVFAKLLPNATGDPGSRIVVLAFRDRKGFQAVEPASYLATNALDLAGLFIPRDDKSYILLRLDSTGDHPYATVYHEYTHYVVRHAQFLPVWLNEGLAQFYQNTDIYDKDVRLGQPAANEILFLRQQKLMPLETLFLVDHNSPYYHEENKGNIFYGESWALTHFLTLADFGKKQNRLHDYATYLAQGEGPLEAGRHAFGDLELLQAQLESYINHGDYRLLTMSLQDAVDEKDLDVEPLPTADADAYRADVLAENGRKQEAEALIHSVLAEAPGSAQAHESMGMIKLRDGDMEAARKWYAEAVALHSTSFLAYYYFGSLSMRDGSAAPEAAADSLRKAVELNPGFAPALESLAQFDVMHHERLDEALQMSLRAVSRDPRNIDYRLTAAEVRVARKEMISAISALQMTAKLAQTPEERARVEARLDQVQQYQAALTQEQTGRMPARSTEASGDITGGNVTGNPASGSHVPGEVKDLHGNVLHPGKAIMPDHAFPDGPATGARHTVTGTLQSVGCFYPKGLTIRIGPDAKGITLYSNDMYRITFTTGNFTPTRDLNPCKEFEGMKARVTYAAVDDPTVAGQIISMELNK